MFFKQVRRNAAKNRKGNGLFFGSLIIAVIAFYTLLSLGDQDVMRYLSTVESDAVSKLMMLLPVVYVISLFFVFFLVYFACKYQMDSRRRELGMYLMLGMKRRRMFSMLFCETLWNSIISLAIGIPGALFLTEGISLTTAKAVGFGIIGHHFSFSATAVLWTVCGFVFVQLLSMLFICIGLGKSEPAELLRTEAVKNQRQTSDASNTLCFLLGLILLLTAYYLGMFQMRSLSFGVMLLVLICGISGTFLLYRGLGGFLGQGIRRKSPNAIGLQTFTARQVQENVLSQHKSLAVASLLLMMALACISYGISMGMGRSADSRSVDFSLFGSEEQIEDILKQEDVRGMIKDSYPLYLSMVKDEYTRYQEKVFDTTSLAEALSKIKDPNGLAENMIENLHMEYIISESSYNQVLKGAGQEEISLSENKVAVYSSIAKQGDFGTILESALKQGVTVGIDGMEYEILPTLFSHNVVADRAISLYMALIVPDTLYMELAREQEAYCQNISLSEKKVKELGLMQAIQKMGALLADTGIEYDSYLGGIGRNLFYTVAASYLTIYLGVLFWLIANTVIGLKYLISQRQTKHRYETLVMLGAQMQSMDRRQSMDKSVKKQISLYFALVLSVALVSSMAAIFTMFTSFTKLPAGTSLKTIAVFSAVALIVFTVVEILYIRIVKRIASREISRIEVTNRR